ncbi:MAG: UDP-2,3-diacylglucosamine diphosphatase LpxI [bacterium]|nr:UDP-2,3-diacylglucosamine diphosphatase LpxI [bacterium]
MISNKPIDSQDGYPTMKIGLIVGRGELPLILARQIKKEKLEIIIISLIKDAQKGLQSIANRFYVFDLGQVQTIMDTLILEGIQHLFMIGKVGKEIIFDPARLDSRARAILARLKDRDDNAIMKAIVEELRNAGIEVLDQTLYLSDLLATKGVLTKKQPDKGQWLDIEYGMMMAKKIARLNIGQAVVVKDRTVLAVEAQEGTDETILRAGRLGKEGLVVAKTSKIGHDVRFDIPTVGSLTIKSLVKAKAGVLAIESGKVIIADKDKMIKKADEAKIVIVGV